MKKQALSILATACAVLLAACGGGGGSTSASGAAVSGAVVKGPVLGATVCAYRINGGAKGALIPLSAAPGASGSIAGGCYVTAANGSYNFVMPGNVSGDVLLEATGGSYCSNESVIAAGACSGGGSVINLGASVLSSAINVPATGNATIYITPLTTAAVNAAAGASFSAATFNNQFNTLAGQVIGAGTSVTAATAPTTSNQPYLAQVATFMQGGGTLASAVGSLQQGSTSFQSGGSGGNTPATVNAALVGNYTLNFYQGGGEGCGTACSYTEGQSVAVTVGANGDLTLPNKVLSNPFYRSYGGTPHLPEVIWLDSAANVEYALSDNSNGTFNEINVGDASRKQGNTDIPVFLGQLRKPQNNSVSALTAFAGTYSLAYQYSGTAVGWTSVTIGNDGAIIFNGGSGPSITAANIKTVYDRINCCGRVDVELNININTDNVINSNDRISLYKDESSSLRAIEYNTGNPNFLSNNTGVRISAGTVPALAAHDGTAIPATNAIHGTLSGSNLHFSTFGMASGNVHGFTIEANDGSTGIAPLWLISATPGTAITAGATYDCGRSSSKHVFINVRRIAAASLLSTDYGGRCSITVTKFVLASGVLEALEGTFTAEVMDGSSQAIPARSVVNGVFRYAKP